MTVHDDSPPEGPAKNPLILQLQRFAARGTEDFDPQFAPLRAVLRKPGMPRLVMVGRHIYELPWIVRGSLCAGAGPRITVESSDASLRVAVIRVKDGPAGHWEYLYDCWRRSDPPAKP